MGCGSSEIKIKENSKTSNKKGNQINQGQNINKNIKINDKEVNLNKKTLQQNDKIKSIKEENLFETNKQIIKIKDNNNKDLTKINNKKSKNSVNQISFKCLYEIKDYNYPQIINNQFEDFINIDIEPKIKILNNNKKESLIFQKRFEKLGLNEIDFIIEE